MARCITKREVILKPCNAFLKLEYSQMESSLLGVSLNINMKQAPENLMSEHYS